MHEQARHDTPPNRVRPPAGYPFASGCSPPRLTATQLPSATYAVTSHGMDFHHADRADSRTHSCAGLTRASIKNVESTQCNGLPGQAPAMTTLRAYSPAGLRVAHLQRAHRAADGEVAIVQHQGARHRSEEHTSELQSLRHLVCRLL